MSANGLSKIVFVMKLSQQFFPTHVWSMNISQNTYILIKWKFPAMASEEKNSMWFVQSFINSAEV